MTISGVPEFILAAAAFVAAVVTIVQVLNRWVVHPAGRQLRETIREEMGPLREELAEVKHQLHANGGLTLRDAVNRIEARQTRIEGEVDAVLRLVGRPNPTEETP